MDHICEECSKHHRVKRADLERGWGLCCSKSCAAKKRERKLDRNNYQGRQDLKVQPNMGKELQPNTGRDLLELIEIKEATSCSWQEDEMPGKDW